MSKRIKFSAWGRNVDRLELPAYAVPRTGEAKEDAVARAIASKNGLHLASGIRSEGASPSAQKYAFTLGRPVLLEGKPDGYSVVAEVWFSIPRDSPTSVGNRLTR